MLIHWIWYAQLKGISLHRKQQLLEHFQDPEELFSADEQALTAAGVTPEMLRALDHKDLTEARQIAARCNSRGIGVLTVLDGHYPDRLRRIYDSPLILYYQGILPDWNNVPVIGIVGTRSATPYGERTARAFGSDIARSGALVVSGGASGIDTAAMEGAVEAQAPTVAVLGCGVDVTYPKNNGQFFRKVQSTGCLLSEYPPQTKAAPWQFLERNRIISGMSNGLLVVEAPSKSGALNTAKHALEQGRDVFAVPGNVDSASCAGSNLLLEEGAIAALSGWAVVRQYAGQYPRKVRQPAPIPEKSPVSKGEPDKISIDNRDNSTYSVVNKPIPALTDAEQAVLAHIGREPMGLDQLIVQTGMQATAVQSVLTRLTVKGLVRSHPGGRVSLKS